MPKKLSREERRGRQRELQEAVRRQNAARTRRGSALKRAGLLLIAVVLLAAAFFAYRTYGATSVSVEAATAGLGPLTDQQPAGPTGSFHAVSGKALRRDGKPVLLFVGALYCPYCASERWAIVKALSRFGTFSHLRTSTSSNGEYGVIPTYDLMNAGYHSRYVVFEHKDVADRSGNALQSLSGQEQSLMNRYDPAGGIPFVYVDSYAMSGSGFSPSDVQGNSFGTVQQQLARTGTAAFVADINGEANLLTAFLCKAGENRPTSVCGNAVISRVEGQIR